MKSILTSLAVLALTASCISTNVTPLSSKTYAEVSPADVDIYLAEEDIPYRYEKIAIIFASGSTNTTDQDEMLKKVRKEAAKLGANGVLVQSIDEPSRAEKIVGTIFDAETRREGEMVAIRIDFGAERE